jgi:hypothetical protein
VTDSPQPLWKELPLPSEEEKRLYEEWVRQKEEEERRRNYREGDRVIVIDL